MGNFSAHPERAWTEYDRELSDKMQDSLIAFARTGNPNTSAVTVPRYDPKNEERVVFGDTIYIDKLNTAQIEFLRAHAPKRDAPGGGPGAPGGGPDGPGAGR
jgi:para-nitrobenzyl esterase